MSSKTPLARLVARSTTAAEDEDVAGEEAKHDAKVLQEFVASLKGSAMLERTATECLAISEWDWMVDAPSKSLSQCSAFLRVVAAQIAPLPKTALEQVRASQWISTGLPELDQALSGGLRSGQLTEFVGRAGTGKSQFCLTICANVVKKGRGVVYFDAERKFSADRFKAIVIACGGRGEDASRAVVIRADDKTTLDLVSSLKQVEAMMMEKDVGLVVIDSVAAIARSENVTIMERQSLLARLATELKVFAETFKLPIVVTNQVMGAMTPDDSSSASPVVPALGNTWHHVVNVRLLLSITHPGNIRNVSIAKSPDTAESQLNFDIDARGVVPSSKASNEDDKQREINELARMSDEDLAAFV